MTAEEVLAKMDVSDGEWSDGRSDELEVDDSDEPILVCDLSSVEIEEKDQIAQESATTLLLLMAQLYHSTNNNSKPIQPNSNSGLDCTSQPTSWSSTLHPLSINSCCSNL